MKSMLKTATLGLSLLLAVAGPALSDAASMLQEKLFGALKRQKTISGQTQLIRLTHVCDLTYKGRSWPVVGTIEQIKGAQTPRGQNKIVILDSKLTVVKAIPYADQHPLFCKGNQLFLNGDLGIDNTEPYGNVLSFFGKDGFLVSKIDGNDMPVPPTETRKTFLLK